MAKGALSLVSDSFSKAWNIFTSRFLDLFSVFFINQVILFLLGAVGFGIVLVPFLSSLSSLNDLSSMVKSFALSAILALILMVFLIMAYFYLHTFFSKRIKEVFDGSSITGILSLYSDIGLGFRGLVTQVLSSILLGAILFVPLLLAFLLSFVVSLLLDGGVISLLIVNLLYFVVFIVFMPFMLIGLFSVFNLVNGLSILDSLSKSLSLIVSNYFSLFVFLVITTLLTILVYVLNWVANFLIFLVFGSTSSIGILVSLLWTIVFVVLSSLTFFFYIIYAYSLFSELSSFSKPSQSQS